MGGRPSRWPRAQPHRPRLRRARRHGRRGRVRRPVVPEVAPTAPFSLGPARVLWTSRADGSFRRGEPDLDARERAITSRPWARVKGVHGAEVAVVSSAGEYGGEADALVTTEAGVPLAIVVADCAPVALASPDGIVAAVHAGWRGLVGGVVEAAAEQMRAMGARHIGAGLGPCIGPECYEFSPADLDAVAARLGDGVRGVTATGAPALDVPAAVRAALDRAGVDLVLDAWSCTACTLEHYSHRARSEPERHAMVVWLP